MQYFFCNMAALTRPEAMNASPHHSKVKATLTLADPLVVAGGMVSGKLEVECKADKGLGISVVMVELFAIEGIPSRSQGWPLLMATLRAHVQTSFRDLDVLA